MKKKISILPLKKKFFRKRRRKEGDKGEDWFWKVDYWYLKLSKKYAIKVLLEY